MIASGGGYRAFLIALLLAAALAPGRADAAPAAGSRRATRVNPVLVLDTPAGERTVPAVGLHFVFYERIYYHRHASRSEAPGGTRTEVEDRRHECSCVRLQDWSRHKFTKTRQIEISYPPDGTVAVLRITENDGQLYEVRADALYGGVDSLPPRFAATVDGSVREFALVLNRPGEAWPEEKLVRILLNRPPPPKKKTTSGHGP